MPKGSKSGAKSSASSGTRKKNARKAAKDEDEDGQPKQQHRPQRGQKKGPDGKKLSKAQRRALPKAKQYIPPPKPPAPPIPDPLDGQGLARTLPAELVVILRRLGKKDDVTRRKGLDELRENWIAPMLQTGGTEEDQVQCDINAAAVESALPVWMHNLASLLQSPFHRSQAIALHDDMLAIPELRRVILDTLSMSYLPGTQERDIIGSWLVAALEEGRRGGQPLKVWEGITCFKPPAEGEDSKLDLTPHLPALAEYLSLSILDPATLHRDIHPPPVHGAFSQPQPPAKGSKGKQLAKARASPAPTPTPPVEESEEVVEERFARYCVGGLVGLSWLVSKLPAAGFAQPPEELAALLNNPVLWSALGTQAVDPDIVPIGTQPPIRRGAYLLLASLIDAYPAEVEKRELLQLISVTLLSNCWNEKEAVVWEAAGTAVVRFLTKYRQCWEIAAKHQPISDRKDGEDGEDDGDEDEGDDDEEDDDDETAPPSRDETAPAAVEGADEATNQPSASFDSFLNFVSTICPSIPHLTYPLLVVVVSTIPSSILPLTSPPSLPLQNLFSHLWSPVDARLLSTHTLGNQPSAFQAFFQSAADITVYLLEKVHANESELAEWLVKEQLGNRLWDQGLIQTGGKGGRRGTTPPETEAKITACATSKLVTMSTDVDALLVSEVERATLDACFNVDEKRQSFLPRALNALTAFRAAGPQIESAVDGIIVKIANGCTERLFEHAEQASLAAAYAEALVDILQKRKDLFSPDRVEVLSQGLQAHVAELSDALPPSLVASLFDSTVAIASEAESKALLEALWGNITSADVDQSKRFALARGVLESKSTGLLHQHSLDAIAVEATRAALSSKDATALYIASAAAPSNEWLSADARGNVLTSVCASVQDAVDDLLTEGGETVLPLESLSILETYAETGLEALVASDESILAVVAVHHLVLLGPKVDDEITVPVSATKIWSRASTLSAESKRKLSAAVSSSLAELLGRVSCRADPDTLVDVALMTDLGEAPTPSDVAVTMLPPAEDLLSQLARHTSQPPHPAMATIDPLVPYVSDPVEATVPLSDFDTYGSSRAARYAEASLALQRVDRSLVASLPYLLNVALSAMILAADGMAIPGASRGLYTPDASNTNLGQVVRDAEGALSFSLTLVDEAPLSWHKSTIEQLKAGVAAPDADYLQRLLVDLRAEVAAKQSDIPVRAFCVVLGRHLRRSEAGEAEGEMWLNYAMSLIDKLPELAHAIILSIKPFMIDSKAFATAQNRLANALTGISVKAANEKGLPALRLLIASAPSPDSVSLFIPQQRALFVLKHVGGWLTSDDEAADEFSDEIDVRVAQLYTALAPIVQDMSGSHWDQIFDLIDGALGSCDLDDPVSYPLLYAGLLLLKEVRDLCVANKQLRELWVAKDEHLGLVVKLFLQCRDADSIPLELIHALILDLLLDAGKEVMAAAGLPELCDLLRLSSSPTIQTTAYRLLSEVVKSRTKALVLEVETAVAEEAAPERTITLPEELTAIVAAGRGVDWHEQATIHSVMTQLLAWMAVLDHFEDASRTLRWAYLDQMNSSRLLEEALLPLLFAMLGVSEVGAWNFPASAYVVDEFYTNLLEPEVLPDLVPLASHVYYRTLVTIPSAMRAYYESLKDRQLSLSLLSFTARHYSPVIIQHEFSALREPRALATLTDEGLSVRIAQGGGAAVAGASSAEAIASYVVDEQPMEIGIRLPAEFPLKAVDVRDLRRVGVPENKWRGWLMGVQQTITSRNGLILEALTVFKKNVALHFEGVVECAICYSIISLTDRTLPTKPCRTCKNRFHASCLFKWFNSSHTSSCPMCRSLF